ncbi:hypothetical protein CVT26_006123, partial [Gymnopilus dilepis]
MSTRPVVSYDDITLPYDPVEPPAAAAQPSPRPEQPPPAKKRKKNNQKGKNRANQHNQPRGQQQQNKLTNEGARSTSHQHQQEEYDESMQDDYSYAEGDAEEGEEEEEESRELTHDEIWDDSALVYAWESAMEEYEAYHGPGEDWKKQPVKKSPLWYNVPPDLSKKAAKAPAATAAVGPTASAADGNDDEAEADSKPLDFDTFVPTHDPSLYPAASSSSALPADVAAGQAPQVDYVPEGGVPGGVVSQDEAFQRALSATYWAGYWTAMYH